MLVLAGGASANIPAGEDQYLEQVPSGGGETGEKSKRDFAESLGGSDGVVTARDVRRAAAKNERVAERAGDQTAADELSDARLPGGSPVTGAFAAAKLGAFSSGLSIALLVMILALGGGVVVRALGSRT
jgi:hypothetical protein